MEFVKQRCKTTAGRLCSYCSKHDWRSPKSFDGIPSGMISVQVPTSLCMQKKLIIHSRYCFVEQYLYPREPNIYMGNLYLRDE